MPGSIHTYPEIDCLCRAVPYHAGGIKNTLLSPMNIRTHIQALLICTLPLSAQGQSIVDSRASLPRAVQLHGDEGRETVRPDESKRISPNEAPASRVQPQRIVNRIAATVNGRPITANEVSVRLMPIGAQLAAQYPKQGPEFYKQLALAKKTSLKTWWSENCSAMNLKAWAASLGTLSLTRKSTAPS